MPSKIKLRADFLLENQITPKYRYIEKPPNIRKLQVRLEYHKV